MATEIKSVPDPEIKSVPDPEIKSESVLATEIHRPSSTNSVFGNTGAKTTMTKWILAGYKTVCMISGPVGCGKTSLARAVLRDSGRECVDVRASPEDLLTMLEDLVSTNPRPPNSLGVVVDEVENLTSTERAKVVKLLTSCTLTVPVICICTDHTETAIKPFMKVCGTHARMYRPSPVDVTRMLMKITPDLEGSSMTGISQMVNGDLRQATMIASEMCRVRTLTPVKADSRISNIFDATSSMFSSPVDDAVKCARFDTLVPVMAFLRSPQPM